MVDDVASTGTPRDGEHRLTMCWMTWRAPVHYVVTHYDDVASVMYLALQNGGAHPGRVAQAGRDGAAALVQLRKGEVHHGLNGRGRVGTLGGFGLRLRLITIDYDYD